MNKNKVYILVLMYIANILVLMYNGLTNKEQSKSSEGRREYRKGKQEDNARVKKDKRD